MPNAIDSSIITSSISPFIYLMMLSLESSHVLRASGLNVSMAGFITGKNLSSTFLPEYSVTEFIFVKYFNASLPTRTIQSYNSELKTISQSRFNTFFIVGSEQSWYWSNSKAPPNALLKSVLLGLVSTKATLAANFI